TASLRFEWKPPHGVWEVIPAEALSAEPSSKVTVVSTAFPPDDASVGYERGSAVSKEWHDATTKAAVEVANEVVERIAVLSGVDERASNRVERLKDFAAEFAARAFRRPLTPELRHAVVHRQFAPGVEPDAALKRSVMLVLKSPRFLYPELGAATDSHAVAGRLALGMWDSLPDEALRGAADRNELRTRDQVVAQARRMVQDPRARAKLREFFHHWLAMDAAEDIAKDTKAYPGFDERLVADLRASLEKFVEEVVWSESSDYRQLLLADYLFMNRRLAEFYGGSGAADTGFTKVKFDPDQRAGILTHPYLLSAFSYHKSSSPIHRGVFLTRNVLGRFLKPPPMAIEFMDDRFDPSLTMREKVTELTKSATCMACHATINPLGFSLENYDATGRFRLKENDKPINAESDYTTAEGEVIHLRGPRDVARHAASSDDARRGFVRQMFHQVVKQSPAAYGVDTLKRLDDAFVESGYHMRHLLVEIVATAAAHGLPTSTPSRP
ncbi:MAG TPA: DUF1592 domain-containing protein, partial [Methylomirabilota bacterium]|nr:DUF1592 domain-containing protein [Methylomirabilota bacterium]